MSHSANEPSVDRPPVTSDVAPPNSVTEPQVSDVAAGGERVTRLGRLRVQTDTLRAYTMIFALIVIWIYLNYATNGIFLGARNFSNLFQQMAVTGVLAVGMLMVIVAGQIDLSVGSVVALLGGISALVLTWGYGLVASLASAIVAGVAIGALQGGLVAYANIPAFIVTLGGMLAWRGLVFILTESKTTPIQDPTYQSIGLDRLPPAGGVVLAALCVAALVVLSLRSAAARRRHGLLGLSAGVAIIRVVIPAALVVAFILYMNRQGGVPIPVVVLLFVAAIGAFLMRSTTFGRYLYAIGGNPDAARLSGIGLRRNILAAFCLMGALAGVAGILHSARLLNAVPSEGVFMELDAIAACVIGGTSLMGGRGTVFGAILGALIMASLDNGMSLLSVEDPMQDIIKGAVLVAAVWFDMLGRRKG